MKVYVIERGAYSDRHIIGVVETEEEAIKICEIVNKAYSHILTRDQARYTEYDTKQFNAGTRFRYFAYYNSNGVYALGIDDYNLFEKYKETCKIMDQSTYVIYAENKDQAWKIARDMKAADDAMKAKI